MIAISSVAYAPLDEEAEVGVVQDAEVRIEEGGRLALRAVGRRGARRRRDVCNVRHGGCSRRCFERRQA